MAKSILFLGLTLCDCSKMNSTTEAVSFKFHPGGHERLRPPIKWICK